MKQRKIGHMDEIENWNYLDIIENGKDPDASSIPFPYAMDPRDINSNPPWKSIDITWNKYYEKKHECFMFGKYN